MQRQRWAHSLYNVHYAHIANLCFVPALHCTPADGQTHQGAEDPTDYGHAYRAGLGPDTVDYGCSILHPPRSRRPRCRRGECPYRATHSIPKQRVALSSQGSSRLPEEDKVEGKLGFCLVQPKVPQRCLEERSGLSPKAVASSANQPTLVFARPTLVFAG